MRDILIIEFYMAMITYTAKEAKNQLGKVFRAAMSEPVEITNHGVPVVQVLSIAQINQLRQGKNRQTVLDAVKHRISCEILSRFSLDDIRKKSIENLDRWRSMGTWGGAYDDWLQVINAGDDTKLIDCMIGSSERSNQLRQSIPYVGMLDKALVRKINEEISA